MIQPKAQILKGCFEGYTGDKKLVNKIIRKFLNYPEVDFIKFIEKDYNFRLEIIRKNLYIIY